MQIISDTTHYAEADQHAMTQSTNGYSTDFGKITDLNHNLTSLIMINPTVVRESNEKTF